MNAVYATARFLPAEVIVDKQADGGLLLRATEVLSPYQHCLGAYLRHWAGTAPERTFLAQRDGGGWQRLSYHQALDEAERIAEALLARGLNVERPLMVLSRNSLNFAGIMLGATLVGIPIVPVSPAYSLLSKAFDKLQHIYALIQPGLIYVEDPAPFSGALGALDLAGTEIVATRVTEAALAATPFPDLLTEPASEKVHEAAAQVGPDSIAKILFTSGSTGMPKGVINTHRMLCSNQQAIMQLWPFLRDRPPVIVDWLPWNHTFGGCHNFNMMLCNGGTLYIDEGKPLPGLIERTVANLREISPTLYFNVPAGYDALLPYLETDEALREHFFAELDLIMYAAASLPQALWDRLEKLALTALGRKVPMLSAWGTTETAPLATSTYRPTSRAGAIGLPIPGTEIKLVPYEEKYELRVRGPNVSPGYWKDPAQTAAAFDEEGFYCTGDAAVLANEADPKEGILFSGRIAEEFKLGTGTWVAVGTLRVAVIEACLPMLQDVIVCGHERNEIGLLMIPNPNGCHSVCPELPDAASLEQLVDHETLRARLVDHLSRFNRDNPASSRRIARAMFSTTPLSIDAGEITDKGYINQRAVLKHRADTVERLYSDDPSVIRIEQEARVD